MSATGRSPVRLAQDVYPTPGYCVDKLLPWLDLNGRDGEPLTFFEPCRGDGAIYDRLPAEVRKGYCKIREGTDYLATSIGRQDIIITNPPFSLALPFLRKSLSEADTVVYLLRLNFLGTVRRKPFWDVYPPTHLFTITPRPRFVNGGSRPRREGFDSPSEPLHEDRHPRARSALRALHRHLPERHCH